MKVGSLMKLSGCLEVVKLDCNEVVGADAKLDGCGYVTAAR